MSGFAAGVGSPGAAQPVDQLSGLLVGHAFPPDVAVERHGAVGENGIVRDAEHGVGVRLHAGAGSHAEESVLGIDGVEAAIGAELHPGDVIADGLDLPAGKGGDHHRQICFATG